MTLVKCYVFEPIYDAYSTTLMLPVVPVPGDVINTTRHTGSRTGKVSYMVDRREICSDLNECCVELYCHKVES